MVFVVVVVVCLFLFVCLFLAEGGGRGCRPKLGGNLE